MPPGQCQGTHSESKQGMECQCAGFEAFGSVFSLNIGCRAFVFFTVKCPLLFFIFLANFDPKSKGQTTCFPHNTLYHVLSAQLKLSEAFDVP